MIRKFIAGILQIYWDFIQRRPRISILFSLILIAACAGAIYLLIVNFPSFMPCLHGACAG